MNFREMTQEQLREESLIDLAYAILEDRKSAINFNDLLAEIKSYNGMTDAELKERLVQFYTDLNVEGRFLLNQENGWGLREWYKVETIEEETAPTVKTRKKKKASADDEDEDDILELDEEDVLWGNIIKIALIVLLGALIIYFLNKDSEEEKKEFLKEEYPLVSVL